MHVNSTHTMTWLKIMWWCSHSVHKFVLFFLLYGKSSLYWDIVPWYCQILYKNDLYEIHKTIKYIVNRYIVKHDREATENIRRLPKTIQMPPNPLLSSIYVPDCVFDCFHDCVFHCVPQCVPDCVPCCVLACVPDIIPDRVPGSVLHCLPHIA